MFSPRPLLPGPWPRPEESGADSRCGPPQAARWAGSGPAAQQVRGPADRSMGRGLRASPGPTPQPGAPAPSDRWAGLICEAGRRGIYVLKSLLLKLTAVESNLAPINSAFSTGPSSLLSCHILSNSRESEVHHTWWEASSCLGRWAWWGWGVAHRFAPGSRRDQGHAVSSSGDVREAPGLLHVEEGKLSESTDPNPSRPHPAPQTCTCQRRGAGRRLGHGSDP